MSTIILELNICLVPSDSLCQEFVAASEKLADTISGKSLVQLEAGHDHSRTKLCIAPHLTLYQVPLLLNDVEKAAKYLERIANAEICFEMGATQYAYNAHEGSLEVQYGKEPRLAEFQMKIVNTLNEMRGNLLIERDPSGQRLDLSNTAVCACGFDGYNEAFNPHVTLNWFQVGTVIPREMLAELETVSMSGTFSHLAIYVLGPHGTCPQLLHISPLL